MAIDRGLYYTYKRKTNDDQKQRIAEFVVENYVEDFHAVLLDAGSTVELIAEEMFKKKIFLTVMTNNMGVYEAYRRVSELAFQGKIPAVERILPGEAQSIEVPANYGNYLLLTGGQYVDVYESLLGDDALHSIDSFTPNLTIIGTSGLSDEGIFCHGYEESAVKKRLWEKQTDTCLIVTDWTKIGKRDARAFGRLIELCKVNGATKATKRVVIVTNLPPDDGSGEVENFKRALKTLTNKEKGSVLLEVAYVTRSTNKAENT